MSSIDKEFFKAASEDGVFLVKSFLDAHMLSRLRDCYEESLRNPGPIAVDYQIDRIRSGGVTMVFTIRDPQSAKVYCDGKRTVCKLSGQTHQPAPWSEPFREAMEAFSSE